VYCEEMNVFSLLSLLASVISTGFGTIVLFRDPKRRLNQVFFLFSLAGSFWAFTEFGYRQAESLAVAQFWMSAGGLGEFSLPLELHFVLCFTGQAKLLERRSTYLLLYAPALAFAAMEVAGTLAMTPVRAYWGWTYATPSDELVTDLYSVWVIALSLAAFGLLLHRHLSAAESKTRYQTGLVTAGLFFPFFLGLATEPGSAFYTAGVQVPELTSTGFIFECALLAYALRKYELFPLTPAAAADSIIATLADALFLVSPDGKILHANQATAELLGYAAGELADQPVHTIFAAGERSLFEQIRDERLPAAGSMRDAETVLIAKDARRIPVSLSASSVQAEDGAHKGIVCVARDLTERKRAEAQIMAALREKDILLKEIHHRVKNNLQMISSLLMLQSEATRSEQALAALSQSRDRIYSMAIIHEMLYRARDLSQVDLTTYTQRLADHLKHSYDVDARGIALKISPGEVLLDADAAIYCGLVIHELVSNAFRHAFPGGRSGEVGIELRTESGRVVLAVSDNGVGLPPDAELGRDDSLGFQLVTMLTNQLGGTVEVDRNGGTKIRVAFGPSHDTDASQQEANK
jgi:PAS domain S-box-containing protein